MVHSNDNDGMYDAAAPASGCDGSADSSVGNSGWLVGDDDGITDGISHENDEKQKVHEAKAVGGEGGGVLSVANTKARVDIAKKPLKVGAFPVKGAGASLSKKKKAMDMKTAMPHTFTASSAFNDRLMRKLSGEDSKHTSPSPHPGKAAMDAQNEKKPGLDPVMHQRVGAFPQKGEDASVGKKKAMDVRTTISEEGKSISSWAFNDRLMRKLFGEDSKHTSPSPHPSKAAMDAQKEKKPGLDSGMHQRVGDFPQKGEDASVGKKKAMDVRTTRSEEGNKKVGASPSSGASDTFNDQLMQKLSGSNTQNAKEQSHPNDILAVGTTNNGGHHFDLKAKLSNSDRDGSTEQLQENVPSKHQEPSRPGETFDDRLKRKYMELTPPMPGVSSVMEDIGQRKIKSDQENVANYGGPHPTGLPSNSSQEGNIQNETVGNTEHNHTTNHTTDHNPILDRQDEEWGSSLNPEPTLTEVPNPNTQDADVDGSRYDRTRDRNIIADNAELINLPEEGIAASAPSSGLEIVDGHDGPPSLPVGMTKGGDQDNEGKKKAQVVTIIDDDARPTSPAVLIEEMNAKTNLVNNLSPPTPFNMDAEAKKKASLPPDVDSIFHPRGAFEKDNQPLMTTTVVDERLACHNNNLHSRSAINNYQTGLVDADNGEGEINIGNEDLNEEEGNNTNNNIIQEVDEVIEDAVVTPALLQDPSSTPVIPDAYPVDDVVVGHVEPLLPWWKQRRTRLFLAAVIVLFAILAVSLGVPLSQQASTTATTSSGCSRIQVAITYDQRPQEDYWQLYRGEVGNDGDGDGDGYENYDIVTEHYGSQGDTSHVESICLEEGEYIFVIIDIGNDGICCENGEGNYNITSNNGMLIAEGGEFEGREETTFSIPYVPP